MKCANRLCCYYSGGVCLLESVEINELGMCDSQIFVELEEEVLRPKREELSARLEGEDEKRQGKKPGSL